MDLKNKSIVFIDLDGTLIDTVSGNKFPISILDVKYKLDTIDALKKFVYANPDKHIYICIITNQLGIGKGFINEWDIKYKLQYICTGLGTYLFNNLSYYFNKDTNVYYDRYILSRYAPYDDEFRKPNTGMLTSLIQSCGLESMPKETMLMIGDASGKEGQFSDSDKKCAENFGIDYLDVYDFINIMK